MFQAMLEGNLLGIQVGDWLKHPIGSKELPSVQQMMIGNTQCDQHFAVLFLASKKIAVRLKKNLENHPLFGEINLGTLLGVTKRLFRDRGGLKCNPLNIYCKSYFREPKFVK